jgi:hypothetical protein
LQRKENVIVEDEVNVTKEIECGKKENVMGQEFPLVNFTIQTIWRSGDKTVGVLGGGTLTQIK